MEGNKEKKESKFKQIKRNIFMSITRKQSTKEYYETIKRIEETGKEIDIKEKRQIRHKIAERNAKRAQRVATVRAASIVLVGVIGLGTTGVVYALNDGDDKIQAIAEAQSGITLDNDENIEKNGLDNFRDKYRVILDNEMISKYGTTEVNLKELYDIRDNVTEEVEKLGNEKEQILNYLKEEYVQQYNKTHEEKINVENITFYRSNNNIVYVDRVINGQEINIVCSETYAKENGLHQKTGSTGQIISVRVNGKIEEIVIGVTDRFERAYSERDEVQQIEQNSILEGLGNVINAGIGYAYSDEDSKSIYEKKLINAMTQYREAKFKETMQAKLPIQKDLKNENRPNGFEIGE